MYRNAFGTTGMLSCGKKVVLDAGSMMGGVNRWTMVLHRQKRVQPFSSGGGPPDEPGDRGTEGLGQSGDGGKHAREGGRVVGGMRGDARGTGVGPEIAIGRGKGAFTHFLRKNQQKIEHYAKAVPASTPASRPIPPPVSGQFDDAPETGFVGPRSASFPSKVHVHDGSWQENENSEWLKKWFNQVESTMEGHDGRMIDLDDDEEEEMADLTGVEYSKDIWWCQNAEQFEEYKEWEAAVDRQEKEQRHQLQEKFDDLKREVLAEGGDPVKMELPDIVITTNLMFNAPPGTSESERAKPLPRRLETIVQSMDLPAGLPVTPTDPEYDQVVNYWKAIAKNNTLDEKMRLELITRITSFIAKNRDNDGFRRAITVQDHSKKKKKKRRGS